MMGRACLKEESKRVKVRFHRKNMLGGRQNGYLLFAERGVLGHRHLVRAPRVHLRKQGNSLIY